MIDTYPGEAREWQRLGIIDARGGPGAAWRDRGLCAQTDPDAFYPESSQAWEGARAKQTCRRCDVTAECLAYALVAGETWGVWGGKSVKQRDRIARPTPAQYVSGEVERIAVPGSRRAVVARTVAQRAAEVLRLLAAGMTPADVADVVGVDRDSVYRIRARHAAQQRAASAAGAA